MAKKTRTPKPPRPSGSGPRQVQAPQRRTGPARKSAGADQRPFGLQYFWPLAAVVVALAIVGVVLGVVLTRGSSKSKPAPFALKTPISWSDLPSLQTGRPPWSNGGTSLSLRLSSLGLNSLSAEQLAFHIHSHLDVFVDGKKVTVPTAVGYGIDSSTGKPQFITELHTHNSFGILHVESAQNLRYTLGQFFGEWGVRLTGKCLGSFKGSCNNLQYWVNGVKLHGNPANVVLKNHEEIAVSVGKTPANVPSTYDFAGHGV